MEYGVHAWATELFYCNNQDDTKLHLHGNEYAAKNRNVLKFSEFGSSDLVRSPPVYDHCDL